MKLGSSATRERDGHHDGRGIPSSSSSGHSKITKAIARAGLPHQKQSRGLAAHHDDDLYLSSPELSDSHDTLAKSRQPSGQPREYNSQSAQPARKIPSSASRTSGSHRPRSKKNRPRSKKGRLQPNGKSKETITTDESVDEALVASLKEHERARNLEMVHKSQEGERNHKDRAEESLPSESGAEKGGINHGGINNKRNGESSVEVKVEKESNQKARSSSASSSSSSSDSGSEGEGEGES